MAQDKKRMTILLLFAFIIGIRLINIGMPILEGTALRQVQTAYVARNFFKEGVNIFYPKVDNFGHAPGYLVLEFPLLNLLTALGYMLLGGVHEWVGRLFSIMFFAGSAYFLYEIVKKIYEEKAAFFAVLIFGLSPLSIIYTRTFMPDSEMIFFSIGSLYFLFNFCTNNDYRNFWLSCIFLSLALLVKPQSSYILVPLFYLIWAKQKRRVFTDYKNWLYVFFAFISAILWYVHGKTVHSQFTQQEAYNYQLLNWFNPSILMTKGLYIDLINIYAGIMLTPVGLSLFMLGLLIKINDKERVVLAWLFGGLLYMLFFITHMWEPYYHLALLPIASIFIARAIVFLEKLDWRRTYLNGRWGRSLLILLILPFWLRYAAYAYVVPKGYAYIVEAGKKVQSISGKDDLIIASAAGGSQALYFCDRKGWGFPLPENRQEEDKAIERLKDYIAKGASYFLAAKIDDFENSTLFKEYLFKNYELIEYRKGKYIIFKLRK